MPRLYRHEPRRLVSPYPVFLPTSIRSFKAATTRQINLLRNTPGAPVWQRNYFEHVIRTEAALDRLRRYILDNPARWRWDRENPARR